MSHVMHLDAMQWDQCLVPQTNVTPFPDCNVGTMERISLITCQLWSECHCLVTQLIQVLSCLCQSPDKLFLTMPQWDRSREFSLNHSLTFVCDSPLHLIFEFEDLFVLVSKQSKVHQIFRLASRIRIRITRNSCNFPETRSSTYSNCQLKLSMWRSSCLKDLRRRRYLTVPVRKHNKYSTGGGPL